MTDIWIDRLSEYLDDELTLDERVELERHLAGCERCREVLGDLRTVVDRARLLEDVPPARDLWPGVAGSIARQSGAHRVSFSMPQLVAAAAFIALISGLSVWVFVGRDRLGDGQPASPGATATPVRVSTVDETYDRAVQDLLRALDEGRERLGPRTVEVVTRNLATIDRAIGDARTALDQDPRNAFLTRHVARERQRKLALLRQVQGFAQHGP
jgi:Putative zinc-finger